MAQHKTQTATRPLECFGKALAACAVDHAWRTLTTFAAWTMQHMGSDGLVQLRLVFFVWQLGAYESIVVIGRSWLVGSIEDEQDVRVRQAPFLELDHVHSCDDSAKERLARSMTLDRLRDEVEQLLLEHAVA